MTKEQEKHLTEIQKLTVAWIDSKYRAGQKRHGGNLLDMAPLQLVDNAIDEAIDQVTYLFTLREKLADTLPSETPTGWGAYNRSCAMVEELFPPETPMVSSNILGADDLFPPNEADVRPRPRYAPGM